MMSDTFYLFYSSMQKHTLALLGEKFPVKVGCDARTGAVCSFTKVSLSRERSHPDSQLLAVVPKDKFVWFTSSSGVETVTSKTLENFTDEERANIYFAANSLPERLQPNWDMRDGDFTPTIAVVRGSGAAPV